MESGETSGTASGKSEGVQMINTDCVEVCEINHVWTQVNYKVTHQVKRVASQVRFEVMSQVWDQVYWMMWQKVVWYD